MNTKNSVKRLFFKSLIPTFSKHTVMMTNKPKVGIKLSLARIFSVHFLFFVSLLFVALLDPFDPYSPFKFLIFY